ncbi:MAG: hypothetical protein HKM04_02605 [Legionellales bacterium]|nr:hypothetical protein [Legionellales bacterium]
MNKIYSSRLNFWRCCKLERRRSCIWYTLPRLSRLRLAKNPIAKSIVSVFLAASTLLSGCGQSGPLYLPPPLKPTKSMPLKPPPTQAPTETVTTTTSLIPQDTRVDDLTNPPPPVNLNTPS